MASKVTKENQAQVHEEFGILEEDDEEFYLKPQRGMKGGRFLRVGMERETLSPHMNNGGNRDDYETMNDAGL